MNASPRPGNVEPFGCILALGIGLVTIIIVYGGFRLLAGVKLDPSEEWGVLLFQVLLVAGPFGLLALTGVRAKLPWIVGIVLTAIFWGFYASVVVASRSDGTGANIGLGLLMLLSPIIVAGGALLATSWGGGKRR